MVSIRRPDEATCTTTSSARAPGRAIETCNSSPNEKILAGGSQTGGADGTASRSKKTLDVRILDNIGGFVALARLFQREMTP